MNSKAKNMSMVLITDYVHPKLITQLRIMGYEPIYERGYDPKEIGNIIPDLTGVIINSKIRMTADVISKAKQLRFIGRLGSGLEIIDLEAAAAANIKVINTPSGNCNAVGEHAVGMLLSLANNLIKAHSEVQQMIWKREENRGIEISGSKVGIIGFGHTGQAFARRLSGFNPIISYYDPYVTKIAEDVSHHNGVDMSTIFSSDIISFHVPLTSETKHMLNYNFIDNCKAQPIIINTSRGKVVDTQALIDGLESKKLSGACLDVFENEKPSSYSKEDISTYNRLFSFNNVVLSPHIAGWTHQSLEKIADVLITKIQSLQKV